MFFRSWKHHRPADLNKQPLFIGGFAEICKTRAGGDQIAPYSPERTKGAQFHPKTEQGQKWGRTAGKQTAQGRTDHRRTADTATDSPAGQNNGGYMMRFFVGK